MTLYLIAAAALVVSVVALILAWPAGAEVREAKPTWQLRKRAELRLKIDSLTASNASLHKQVRGLSSQLSVRGESEPIMAIRFVFGPYADQAIRVSSCETGGTFSVNATNGQYLGLFQMGDYARGRYGHGPTAIQQAKSAYAYFAASGRDWSPWECKP